MAPPHDCQAEFEVYDDNLNGLVIDEHYGIHFGDDAIFFNFGERVISATDLLDFPRG